MARQLSRSLKLFAFIDILLCVLYIFAVGWWEKPSHHEL